MKAGRIIAYLVAAVLMFFGVLFIWGAFSPDGSTGWILIGLIQIGISFGLIYLAGRKSSSISETNQVSYKIDLPGNFQMDSLKCKSCGGTLTQDNISMVAGAPLVTCPYCKSTYQLTEEPKW